MSDSRPAMNQSTNSPIAVRVSRKGRTNPSDLALKYIGSFLNYANSAEIAYANSVFIFSRLPLNELEA
jgi:hypothetical protein